MLHTVQFFNAIPHHRILNHSFILIKSAVI